VNERHHEDSGDHHTPTTVFERITDPAHSFGKIVNAFGEGKKAQRQFDGFYNIVMAAVEKNRDGASLPHLAFIAIFENPISIHTTRSTASHLLHVAGALAIRPLCTTSL